MNALYDLTQITGKKANRERTTIVGTFELKQRTFYLALLSLVPAFIVVGLLFPLLHEIAILAAPLVYLAMLWLFNSRRPDGLNLYQFQYMRDRYGRKSKEPLHTPMFCHEPLDTQRGQLMQFLPTTQPRVVEAQTANRNTKKPVNPVGRIDEHDARREEDVEFTF